MNNFKLDKFQEEAIAAAQKNHSVIVSAPTGAGKTLIAEQIIEDCIINNKGIIYTAPIKALSNQKFRDFSKKYPRKTGILTGDVSINRNAPILIMTTEIFRNAILVEPQSFKRREWVIFDEIHYLDDPERGTVWEEAIILLPQQMKMLALSATIPNIDQFIGWLGKIHAFPLKTIVEKVRPVPLHFFFQCDNQVFYNFAKLKQSMLMTENLKNPSYQEKYALAKPNRLKSLLKNIDDLGGYPCVYFSFSRRKCEELAQETGQFDFLSQNEKDKIIKMFDGLLDKFDISSSPHINFLAPLIKRGIAYHHAGLLPALKEIIERLFTTGLIKLIFTTETFALGINMPAKTVIFNSLSKFYGRYHAYLKTRDFYQMAGRAGRRGIDKEGFVFSRVNPSHIDIISLEKIIYGRYEPIRSQFNSCYATILNLFKIMGDTIYDIYPRSFHFHQNKAWGKKEVLDLLKRKMSLLKTLGYINGREISRKARLAAKVYSFELTIGELFEAGYLDGLSEEDLFVLITALIYEPRKGEKRPKLNKQTKTLKRQVDKFVTNIHKDEKRFRVYPLSKRFFFYLSEACRMWFSGMNFLRISQSCSIDEGEIVRYFRMAIQVLREIYSSDTISDSLKIKIANCLRKVNRDVVDAQKQLGQEI
ncbi:MAG: DEAD/DEAH box helicase [Candidatus Omnitrophota bacterium]